MSNKPVAAGKSSIDLIDIDKVFDAFDLKPHSTFLDMACGVGRYSLEAARRHGHRINIHAVDLWQEGIAQLQSEIAAQNITTIKPLLADIRTEIDLDDNSIDSCLLATILHDLAEQEQKAVVRQSARLLKPGGTLNIVEFKKVDFGPGPPIKIRLNEHDIDTLVSPFGYKKVNAIDAGEFTYHLRYQYKK